LRNRVTPFGEIVAVPGRGAMMGNRGVLHDRSQRIVRPWQVRRWIACLVEFRGRRRTVMQPNRYTELFFLDEAAAFSAGHRPCAECRNADYRRFRDLWQRVVGLPADADAMDAVLHRERVSSTGKVTYREKLAALPDGAYVALDEAAWLVWGKQLYAWSDAGYTARRSRPASGDAVVLTPRSIVALFAAGYLPTVALAQAPTVE
jgi:hypothetical protein